MTAKGPMWRPLLLIWLLLSVLSALWSIATPISAAPDEPSHFIKAASVVRGQFIGAPSSEGSVVQVPEYVAFSQAVTCFAFQPEVTAGCSPTDPAPADALVDSTTTAGLYNPVYYLLTGWPTLLFHNGVGLYAMRIVSGLISSLFLAVAGVQLLALRRRALPLLAFAVAVTPMVLFLDASENPNSLEVSAVMATFVTMFMVVRHHDPRLLPTRAITLLIAASIGVTMRGISPLWIAIALFAPLALVRAETARALVRSRWAYLAAGVIALATLFAIVWIIAAGALGFTTEQGSAAPGIGASPLAGFALILFGTFDYAQGFVGVFGWLDTPAPLAVFFVWAALFGTLLLLAIAVTRGRARAFVLSGVAALVLVPPLLQAIYIHGGGIIWQGRYALPLFVCVVLAMGLLLAEAMPELEPATVRAAAITALSAWTVAQVYAFATALRRYAVGLTGGPGAFITHPEWAPPGGVLPVLIAFGVVTVLTAALALLAVLGRWVTPELDANRTATLGHAIAN